jgi:hypothetical protein
VRLAGFTGPDATIPESEAGQADAVGRTRSAIQSL